ncbi:carbon-nitrogen hydrolase family protein [Actinocatenispora sera]|uniref:Hydrolase n=1 Tax=Actinocatenispora sera TaxID=390989 RepID=A0A810L063_9ACTN|nr:carbon-nitrogen hydrolase family protein [Actinocatenispora sera]BCJ27638.1 hydrolase [Actinocatenispora sera]
MVCVAVGQFSAGTDKQANLTALAALTEQAAAAGAGLVAFPEYSMYATRALDAGILDSAEPVDGPFATKVAELAARYRIRVLYGMNETLPGERRVSNTLLAFGPDGDLLASYRKVHLFDAFGYAESDWVAPGDPDQLCTFDADGLRFGAMTCYDLRFPELARRLADAGVQALVVPAQWATGPQKEDHWRLLARARAVENTVYLLAADQCAPTGAGNSVVVDPMGVPVAGVAEAAGIAVTVLEPERVAAVRRRLPSLQHRRFRVEPGDPAPLPDAGGDA